MAEAFLLGAATVPVGASVVGCGGAVTVSGVTAWTLVVGPGGSAFVVDPFARIATTSTTAVSTPAAPATSGHFERGDRDFAGSPGMGGGILLERK